jgi:uncharacterized damage-inducible protein DinB
VLHLSGNVRQWIIAGLGGEPDARVRDSEFEQTEIIPREDLQTLLTDTLVRVKAVLENLPSDTLLESRRIQGEEVGVLEAIFHVIEHFAMHTGQIITLTKILTEKDLRFYDFADVAPREQWKV